MIYFDFDYERAASLEQAVTMLGQLGDDGRALAGGTDLLPSMRMENIRPGVLVSLGAIEPAAPERLADGSIRLDALSRLSTLENSPLLAQHAPMVAQSAHVVGGNQIRQMGTLGGNLCQEIRCLYLDQRHDYQFVAPCYKRGGDCCYPYPRNTRDTCWSVYMSDVAPALIALDAEVDVLGAAGMRRIPVEALFTGNGLRPTQLAQGELLRAVVIPPQGPRSGWGFHKSTVRGGLEFGMAVMAVSLQLSEDGRTCTQARVALGAIREKPLRALGAEQALIGTGLDDTALEGVAADAAKEVNPLPHHGFTKRHLMDNIRVYLRRTLEQAVERARSGTNAG